MPSPAPLGECEIRRELGRGSMGVVYEAFDSFIQRPVAIKVIRQDEFQPSQVRELLPRCGARRNHKAAAPPATTPSDNPADDAIGLAAESHLKTRLRAGVHARQSTDARASGP